MILLFPLLLMVGGCRLGAHQDGERQSWARDNCLDSRQRNRASWTRKNSKNIKVSLSRWSCHNEYSKNAKSKNFEA